MTSEALRERLRALRRAYVQTFDAEADALALDRKLLDEPSPAEANERVRRRAHRLAGTAGTYALNELHASASLVEASAKTADGVDTSLVDALIVCLREYVLSDDLG